MKRFPAGFERKLRTVSDEGHNPDLEFYPDYRCARCGTTFTIACIATRKTLCSFVINGPTVIQADEVYKSVIHTCADNGAGIARIVGMTLKNAFERQADILEDVKDIIKKEIN